MIGKKMEKAPAKKLQISGDEKATPQESAISKLNDDCLINIFRHLSIKERITSERGIFVIIFFKVYVFKDKMIYSNVYNTFL